MKPCRLSVPKTNPRSLLWGGAKAGEAEEEEATEEIEAVEGTRPEPAEAAVLVHLTETPHQGQVQEPNQSLGAQDIIQTHQKNVVTAITDTGTRLGSVWHL